MKGMAEKKGGEFNTGDAKLCQSTQSPEGKMTDFSPAAQGQP